MLIDFHTHMFPERLAARTLQHLSEVSGGPYHTDGTRDGTLAKMDEWGVDYAVVLHIATRDKQQDKINRFALEVQQSDPRLLSFGTVFPGAENQLEVVRGVKASGMYGVKLHPEYQDFFFGEERYFPLYEEIARLGLPLTIHAGWDPVGDKDAPLRAPAPEIAKVAKTFPNLTLIAAHMGALADPKAAGEHLAGLPNVYFDTAMSAIFLEPGQLAHLIARHGADRVLFGTDLPWDTVPRELDALKAAGVTGGDLELILWKNAARLLGLAC